MHFLRKDHSQASLSGNLGVQVVQEDNRRRSILSLVSGLEVLADGWTCILSATLTGAYTHVISTEHQLLLLLDQRFVGCVKLRRSKRVKIMKDIAGWTGFLLTLSPSSTSMYGVIASIG
jgi:hypothetical protein